MTNEEIIYHLNALILHFKANYEHQWNKKDIDVFECIVEKIEHCNTNICETCRYYTFDMGGGRACFIASCNNNSEYELEPMIADFLNNRDLREIYIKGDPEKWEEIKKILNRPES